MRSRPPAKPRWAPRARAREEMIYGMHPVLEALRAGRDIERITISEGVDGPALGELKQVARQLGVPVKLVPPPWFQRLGARNHQGIVATVSPITYQAIESLVPYLYDQGVDPLLVLADGITDVRNLGAIVRTAECAGAHAVVVPMHGSANLGADAVKASAGALLHLPICRVGRLEACCDFLHASGLRLVGATERGVTHFHGANLLGPLAIILGDEHDGISPSVLQRCDQTVRIPIHGQVQSLNVSVSAGIILYEAEHQRRG